MTSPHPRLVLVLLALPLIVGALAARAADTPTLAWKEQVLSSEVGIGYAVAVADMNGDRKPDVLLVDADRVAWFQNPTWQRHEMLVGSTPRDNVCLAATDLDGDRRAEVALGAYWKPSDTVGSGSVHWLQRGIRPEDPWTPKALHAEPTIHRMRWADVDGDGTDELLVAPLHGKGNQGPNIEGAGVRLLAYRPPARDGAEWTTELMDDALHVVHNIWPLQWDGDPSQEVMVASFEGVSLLDRGPDGKWRRTLLAEGNQATRPNRGSSEIRAGRLRGGARVFATVEPWHGHQVVAYTSPADRKDGALWERHVLDESLKEAHGVWFANLDGRPGDELVIGWRAPDAGKKVGVIVFRALDGTGVNWERLSVDDNGMACEDLTAADLDADGRPEIIAAGRATHNLKIYWNRTGLGQ